MTKSSVPAFGDSARRRDAAERSDWMKRVFPTGHRFRSASLSLTSSTLGNQYVDDRRSSRHLQGGRIRLYCIEWARDAPDDLERPDHVRLQRRCDKPAREHRVQTFPDTMATVAQPRRPSLLVGGGPLKGSRGGQRGAAASLPCPTVGSD
jgi:hypothetical protein